MFVLLPEPVGPLHALRRDLPADVDLMPRPELPARLNAAIHDHVAHRVVDPLGHQPEIPGTGVPDVQRHRRLLAPLHDPSTTLHGRHRAALLRTSTARRRAALRGGSPLRSRFTLHCGRHGVSSAFCTRLSALALSALAALRLHVVRVSPRMELLELGAMRTAEAQPPHAAVAGAAAGFADGPPRSSTRHARSALQLLRRLTPRRWRSTAAPRSPSRRAVR